MSIDAASGVIQWTPTEAGEVDVSVRVADGRSAIVTQEYTISVSSEALVQVPNLVGLGQNGAIAAITRAALALGSVTTVQSETVPAGKVVSQDPIAATPVARGSTVSIAVSTGPAAGGTPPPDPVDVAPPLDTTGVTPVHEATEFLYTGANPIQTGVAPGTIAPVRAAVVRGQVLDTTNAPLPGVTITIEDHPELGRTLSRSDGRFDMAVNGGGLLTVRYERAGHLPAQRQVQAPWQDYVVIEDVVMAGLDPELTAIDLAATTSMQVARGSVTTDPDGSRQATVLFPAGAQATMILPDPPGRFDPGAHSPRRPGHGVHGRRERTGDDAGQAASDLGLHLCGRSQRR